MIAVDEYRKQTWLLWATHIDQAKRALERNDSEAFNEYLKLARRVKSTGVLLTWVVMLVLATLAGFGGYWIGIRQPCNKVESFDIRPLD
jgi:hypothetical protein